MTGFNSRQLTDGGSKTYTSADIDADGYIDGFALTVDCDGSDAQPGSIPVSLSYMAHTFGYSLTLIPSPVASVSMLLPPNKTDYQLGYGVDFVGTRVEIRYTDGTVKTVTATADNLVYGYVANDNAQAYIDVDGYRLWFYADLFDPTATDLVVNYLGATSHYAGVLSRDDALDLRTLTVERVSPDGAGMTVSATYVNSGSITFTVDPIKLYYFEQTDPDGTWYGQYEGVTRTARGMVYYRIVTHYQGRIPRYYELHLFDRDEVFYPDPILPGDLDGDGRVEADDLVDLRQVLLRGDDPLAADVNGDGKADIRDLVALKKLLADI